MYRTANNELRQKGAPQFLQQIVQNETGFPALQALLALLHIMGGEEGNEQLDIDWFFQNNF